MPVEGVLRDLASDVIDVRVDAYVTLRNMQMVEGGTVNELDTASEEQLARLVAACLRDVQCKIADIETSALRNLGAMLNDVMVVGKLCESDRRRSLAVVVESMLTQSKSKCNLSVWVLSVQNLPSDDVRPFLPRLLGALSEAFKRESTSIQQESLRVIGKLLGQLPNEMKQAEFADLWVFDVSTRLVSDVPRMRRSACDIARLCLDGALRVSVSISKKIRQHTLDQQDMWNKLNDMMTVSDKAAAAMEAWGFLTSLLQPSTVDHKNWASIMNKLMQLPSKAFKSSDPVVRVLAFDTWKRLIDCCHQRFHKVKCVNMLMKPVNFCFSAEQQALVRLACARAWCYFLASMSSKKMALSEEVLSPIVALSQDPDPDLRRQTAELLADLLSVKEQDERVRCTDGQAFGCSLRALPMAANIFLFMDNVMLLLRDEILSDALVRELWLQLLTRVASSLERDAWREHPESIAACLAFAYQLFERIKHTSLVEESARAMCALLNHAVLAMIPRKLLAESSESGPMPSHLVGFVTLMLRRLPAVVPADRDALTAYEAVVALAMAEADPIHSLRVLKKELLDRREGGPRGALWSVLARALREFLDRAVDTRVIASTSVDYELILDTLAFPFMWKEEEPARWVDIAQWEALYEAVRRIAGLRMQGSDHDIVSGGICARLVTLLEEAQSNSPFKHKELMVATSTLLACIVKHTGARSGSVSPAQGKRKREDSDQTLALVAVLRVLLRHLPMDDSALLVTLGALSRLASKAPNIHYMIGMLQLHGEILLSAECDDPEVEDKAAEAWAAILDGMLRHADGHFSDELLRSVAQSLAAVLSRGPTAMVNSTIRFWGASFGRVEGLHIPDELAGVLDALAAKGALIVPSRRATDGPTGMSVSHIQSVDSSGSVRSTASLARERDSLALQTTFRYASKATVRPKGRSRLAAEAPRKKQKTGQASMHPPPRPDVPLSRGTFVSIPDKQQDSMPLTDHQREVLEERATVPLTYSAADRSDSQHGFVLETTRTEGQALCARQVTCFLAFDKSVRGRRVNLAEVPSYDELVERLLSLFNVEKGAATSWKLFYRDSDGAEVDLERGDDWHDFLSQASKVYLDRT